MDKQIYVVKFDRGYYADKQPSYEWSYTNDLLLAKQYKNKKQAQERAKWGLNLMNAEWRCSEASIEAYVVTVTMTRVI